MRKSSSVSLLLRRAVQRSSYRSSASKQHFCSSEVIPCRAGILACSARKHQDRASNKRQLKSRRRLEARQAYNCWAS